MNTKEEVVIASDSEVAEYLAIGLKMMAAVLLKHPSIMSLEYFGKLLNDMPCAIAEVEMALAGEGYPPGLRRWMFGEAEADRMIELGMAVVNRLNQDTLVGAMKEAGLGAVVSPETLVAVARNYLSQ